MVVVITDIAAPVEIYEDKSSRVKKPIPYAVCAGCNGPVHEDMSSRTFKDVSWHSECYEGGDGVFFDEDEEEEEEEAMESAGRGGGEQQRRETIKGERGARVGGERKNGRA